jgi:hypothetical protein
MELLAMASYRLKYCTHKPRLLVALEIAHMQLNVGQVLDQLQVVVIVLEGLLETPDGLDVVLLCFVKQPVDVPAEI